MFPPRLDSPEGFDVARGRNFEASLPAAWGAKARARHRFEATGWHGHQARTRARQVHDALHRDRRKRFGATAGHAQVE